MVCNTNEGSMNDRVANYLDPEPIYSRVLVGLDDLGVLFRLCRYTVNNLFSPEKSSVTSVQSREPVEVGGQANGFQYETCPSFPCV